MPCHDKHEVGATSWLAGIAPDSACSRCHARDEKVRRAAEEIASVLREVRTIADAARSSLAEAKRAGILVSGASTALDEISTQELSFARWCTPSTRTSCAWWPSANEARRHQARGRCGGAPHGAAVITRRSASRCLLVLLVLSRCSVSSGAGGGARHDRTSRFSAGWIGGGAGSGDASAAIVLDRRGRDAAGTPRARRAPAPATRRRNIRHPGATGGHDSVSRRAVTTPRSA
jgi:hypothetical protein